MLQQNYCRNGNITKVTGLLHRMGVPAHLKGYYYLRSAIMISLQENNMVCSVTKLLYPKIAKEYFTTEQKVERGIRNAIEVAWKHGSPDFFEAEFGYSNVAGSDRPSNSECIARVVDHIRMEEMLEEELLEEELPV
ncbi:MAG: sporulation initiation factor Spo0A C-terminal domain-containing protein [Lachnospiraceae bacterium]|nr:sporulation initiation factor Spo0A C-terminal domain-containing protein [Lachnospiraceae bacterium]MDE6744233.1 sporulation initiation factor Spo0A C-terminal domain-containing protein [Lachnospiraceae bacterium]